MKEKLIIRNFGPIKDVELELGRFNVLIGEQATGKSTVAKLLAVCRYFSYIVDTSYLTLLTKEQQNTFLQGLESWGLGEFVNEDSHIFYQSHNYTLTVRSKKVTRKFKISGKEVEAEQIQLNPTLENTSKEFQGLLEELDRIRPVMKNPDEDYAFLDWNAPTSFYQNDVARVMDNPFYLPAERGLQSIFSLGKNTIQNISDSLFNQLANLDRIARLFKNETVIEPLEIIYKNVDGRGYIKKPNDSKFFSLFNAATGYQSTIPVVLVIKYYNDHKRKNKTLIVEEVELNLYPTAQRKTVQYLADEVMNYGNSVLLTTHSPYVLTSLNNLIYAYRLGQLHREKIEQIIERKYWLNESEVSVYKMLPDGTCENIFDNDEGLIKAEKIDDVSSELNKVFDQLMNVEFKKDDQDA